MASVSTSSQKRAKRPLTHSPLHGFPKAVIEVGATVVVVVVVGLMVVVAAPADGAVVVDSRVLFCLSKMMSSGGALSAPYTSRDTQHRRPGLHSDEMSSTASQ